LKSNLDQIVPSQGNPDKDEVTEVDQKRHKSNHEEVIFLHNALTLQKEIRGSGYDEGTEVNRGQYSKNSDRQADYASGQRGRRDSGGRDYRNENRDSRDGYRPRSEISKMHVPNNLVGLIIGKKGENIREMQQKSGASIRVALHFF